MKIITFLRGKKSYIISGLGVVTVGAWLLGYIDEDTTAKILALLGFGGIAALRDAISKK